MKWQEIDQKLREGAKLCMHGTFGAWIEHDGKEKTVHFRAANAIIRRGLVVVSEKRGERYYAFRSKHYPRKYPETHPDHNNTTDA